MDLTERQNTFAQIVTTNAKRLGQLQNDRAALMEFFEEAVVRANVAGHLSDESARKYRGDAAQCRTAGKLLQFIFNMSLAGARLKVV